MAAVERRDGEDVHESKCHGEEGGDVPESDPVPFLGEDASDRAETADALSPLLGEDLLHRLGVVGEVVGAEFNSAGD